MPSWKKKIRLAISGLLAAWVALAVPAALAEVTVTTAYTDNSTAYKGDVRTLRITLQNGEATPVKDGALQQHSVLPDEFVIADPSRVSNTCGGEVVAASGGRDISFSGATIPAQTDTSNGICYIEIDVKINTNSASSYSTTVGAGMFTGTQDDGTNAEVSNAGDAPIGLTVETLKPLSASKRFNPSTIRMGETSTITITITNDSVKPVSISKIQEQLPDNITAVGTVTGGTCGAGNASGTSGTVDIALDTEKELAANGGSCTVTWDVTGNVANGNSASGTNRIPADGVTNDREIPSGAASKSIEVQSPVTLSKGFEYQSVRPDQPVKMTITVKNRSAAAAAIAFSDQLPSGMVFSDPSNLESSTSCNASASITDTTLSLGGGSLDALATCTVTAYVQAANPNASDGEIVPYKNTIDGVTWTQGSNTYTTDSASAEVTVFNEFTIHKSIAADNGQSFGETGVVPGDLVKFSIELRNYSGAPVTGVGVTDKLPKADNGAQLIVSTAPYPATTTCVGSGIGLPVNGAAEAVFSGLTVPEGSAAVHGECQVEFWARVPSDWPVGTGINNDLSESGNNYGITCDDSVTCEVHTGGQNGSGVEAGTASANHLVIDKSFAPDEVSQGQVSVLTIALNNNGFWPLNVNELLDRLPTGFDGENTAVADSQLRIAPIPGANTTCAGSPVYSYGGDRNEFKVTGLQVPARSICYVSVNVVGALAASYPNEIKPGDVAAKDSRHERDVLPAEPATATLTIKPTFEVTKSFSVSPVAADGGESRVTIKVENTGNAALTGLRVHDPLAGTGLLVADEPGPSTTCAGPYSFNVVAGADSATMTGARVDPNTSCTFSFNVVTDGTKGTSVSENILPPGAVTADGGLATNTSTKAELGKLGGGDAPKVEKSFVPDSLNTLGETSLLTIRIDNTADNSVKLTSVGLTDLMPEAMEVAASPQASTSCAGGVVTAVPGSNQVKLSGATLEAKDSCEVYVRVTLNTSGTFTNTAEPGWLVNDQNISNTNTYPANLGTVSRAGVDKTFSPSTIAAGESSLMTIRVINQGTIRLSELRVTDELPDGMRLANPHNANTTCGGNLAVTNGKVELTGGTVAAGSECRITVNLTADEAGSYTNKLNPGDASSKENPNLIPEDPVIDTLEVLEPLEITKKFDEKTRLVNEANEMTLVITNPNTNPITDVRLTDNYPAGMFNTTDPQASVSCPDGVDGVVTAPASGNFVRLTGATLAAKGICTIKVNVLSNVPGTYVNTIPEKAIESAEGATNKAPAADDFEVVNPPTLGKFFDPVQIAAGDTGTSKLTIRLGNPNGNPITLTADLNDNLPQVPGSMTATGIESKTCPGNVTLHDDGKQIRYPSGATIPADGCDIVVNVTASVPGRYVNLIPAGELKTDAGDNPEPGQAELAISAKHAITGKVYMDDNNDGVADAGEEGIAGQVIELWKDGQRHDTTVTDSLGNYSFLELDSGTYEVRQPGQPANTLNGKTTAGAIGDGTATNESTVPSAITGIELDGEAKLSTGNNFGELAYGSISGKVFLDSNNDGSQQGGEPGLPGEIIELYKKDGDVWVPAGTTQTSADGSYNFPNLEPGDYRVVQPEQPAGTTNGTTSSDDGSPSNDGERSQIDNIQLGSGQASTNNNFAEIPNNRTLSGKVFLDYDGNGSFDGDDHGIGGQPIELHKKDGDKWVLVDTVQTDADGNYSFTNLPEGEYAVIQPDQPEGTSNGITTKGTAGGEVDVPAGTSGRIHGIDLTGANTVSSGNNFAEIPGDAPDLTIGKNHSPTQFAEGGGTGYFTLTSKNIGKGSTAGIVTVVDTLPVGMTARSATGDGWSCQISANKQAVTCTTDAVFAPGDLGKPILVHVDVAAGQGGNWLINVADISVPNEPEGFKSNNRAEDAVEIIAGAESASIEGTVWRDTNSDRKRDPGEPVVPDWNVQLYENGVLVAETKTDANGKYKFSELPPGSNYEVRFRSPEGNVLGQGVTNEQNTADNLGNATPGYSGLSGITLTSGQNLTEQSLPLDPSGVIYDAVTRQPVQGAVVTLLGPGGTPVPSSELEGGTNTIITGPDGYYEFVLKGGASTGSGVYTLQVTSPGGYKQGPSDLLPACTNTPAVGATPDPALVQNRSHAPADSVPVHEAGACEGIVPGGSNTTQYFYSFSLTLGTSANVVNNHIPLDPILGGAIVMTKTTPKVNVVRGEMVPYVLTATNTLTSTLVNVAVEDQIPAGFKYVKGSSQIDSLPNEPVVNGRHLKWSNLTLNPGQKLTFKMLLVVGTGVGYNEYVNQTWAMNEVANSRISNVATATVRVVADPTFECSDLIGTVYDDKNRNGYQDKGEPGLPGVRVATPKGWLVTTDNHGRYHIACADVPNEMRGGNFIVKVDERTLPSGYRVVTENPRVVRLSQGRLVKANFGASIHRVVRLDLTPDAFDGKELKPGYQEQMGTVMQALHAEPSILRIAYRLPVGEKPKEARERIKSVTKWVKKNWEPQECCYDLQLEEEIVPAIDSVEVVR